MAWGIGRRPLFWCAVAVWCGGCGANTGPAERIDLSADVTTVFVGDSVQLVATLRDAAGRVVNGTPVVFTSSDTARARVNSTGLVRGVSRGSASVSASSQGFSTQVLLNVRLGGRVGPTGGVVRVPNVVLLRIPSGAVQQTIEVDFDSLPSAGAPNLVPGTAFIVGPPDVGFGQAAELTVYYRPTAVTPGWEKSVGMYQDTDSGWIAVNGSFADLDQKSVTAPISGPGSYSIFAPGPVATVTVRPSIVTVPTGTSASLACDVQDSAGNYLTNRPIAWTSADTTIIRVTQRGRVIPGELGTTTVTARSGGVSGTATVTAAFVCQCLPGPGGTGSSPASCSCSSPRGTAR